MGPQVWEELGRLRLQDLLAEAAERSKSRAARRSPRRPAPRTGEEA
jgi:hypothetical protein